MSIEISKHSASVAAQSMLVENVPTLSGVHGVLKDSANPHALVTERLSLVWLGTMVEIQYFTQVGAVANCLEFAFPGRTLRIVIERWE